MDNDNTNSSNTKKTLRPQDIRSEQDSEFDTDSLFEDELEE